MQAAEIRNISLNIFGEGLWGFMAAMIPSATVLTFLLGKYGAGDQMIAGITAVEGAGLLLPQILGNYIFRSRRRRKVHMILWHLLAMLPCLVFIGVVSNPALHLAPQVRRWCLLAGWGGYFFTMGTGMAVWMDWMAHLFRQEIRGRVLGVSWSVSAVLGIGGALLAGYLIKTYPGSAVYSWLYLAAGAIGGVSMTLYMFMDDSAARDAVDPPPLTLGLLAKHFTHSLRDTNFRRFLIGRIIVAAGFCIGPFVALYYRSPHGGAMQEADIVRFFAAQTGCMAVAMLVLGHVGDRHGHRIGIITGAVAQVAALIVLLTTGGWASCGLAYALIGVVFGTGVSYTNIILETCPHEDRAVHPEQPADDVADVEGAGGVAAALRSSLVAHLRLLRTPRSG